MKLVESAKPPIAGAQTLRRGLSIVRLLTQIGPSGLRMGEIGRKLGLTKATAVRLTLTLVEEGFVVQDRATGRYRLGPEAFAAGLAAEPNYELQRRSAPTLRALAAESGDTVFFTVLHGYEGICLSRDEGDFPIRNQLIKPGDRWPLGVGAGSCAILAALPDDEIRNVLRLNAGLRAERFPRCTDDQVWQLVASTRAIGYCMQPGLVLDDSWAVGVVVRDVNAQPVASISIAAIRSRLDVGRSAIFGNRLLQASDEIGALQDRDRAGGEPAADRSRPVTDREPAARPRSATRTT